VARWERGGTPVRRVPPIRNTAKKAVIPFLWFLGREWRSGSIHANTRRSEIGAYSCLQ
jgi:hypothetical protein